MLDSRTCSDPSWLPLDLSSLAGSPPPLRTPCPTQSLVIWWRSSWSKCTQALLSTSPPLPTCSCSMRSSKFWSGCTFPHFASALSTDQWSSLCLDATEKAAHQFLRPPAPRPSPKSLPLGRLLSPRLHSSRRRWLLVGWPSYELI